MSQPWIVQGDRTSHGGTVIEGDPTFTTHGKPVAHVGHMTTCPRCKGGPFPIVTGAPDMINNGRPVARHGDRTSCGAPLIAGQFASYWSSERGTAASADSSPVSGSTRKYSSPQTLQYDEQFTLKDSITGMPLTNFPYRIRGTAGTEIEGVTDEMGRISRVKTAAAEELIIEHRVGENDGW